MPDHEPAPTTSSIKEELISDPRFDELFVRLNEPYNTQPSGPISEKPPIPKPSRRRFLGAGLALAGTAILGGGYITNSARTSENTTQLPEAANEKISSFNELIKPLIEEAHRRRQLHPEGIDWELNRNRINIGLSTFAQGQGESITILSYDLVTGTITSVITTRETLCPEVISYSKQKRPNVPFTYQMDASSAQNIYQTWGFDLMRQVIQNQTGLSADFQFYLEDVALYDFIKDVLEDKVELEVEKKLQLVDFAFDRRWKDKPEDPDEFELEAGKHTMTAKQAMRYILSDSNQEWVPGVNHQLPERKNHVIKAAINRFTQLLGSNPAEAGRTGASLIRFFQQKLSSGQLASDYDLLGGNGVIPGLLAQLGKAKLSGTKITFPEVGGGGGLQINDELFGDSHGDVGIIRVNRLIDNDKPNDNYYRYAHPSVQRQVDRTIELIADLKAKGIDLADPEKGMAAALSKVDVLPPWMQVPILGDLDAPDNELVEKYWAASRKLVKEKLMSS